jgi:hypothetical protein
MSAITSKQLDLLHHTLGVMPERRESYRNHFVAGRGHHDQADLEAPEAAGLMTSGKAPAFCEPGDVVFRCTDAGRAYAIERLPQPPKRSKWDDYYHSESSLTFAEWLGIEVPEREYNHYARYGDPTRDYVRLKSSRATGEWKPTVKEAKASYKAAMAARKERERECLAAQIGGAV